ncbi:MAG: NADH-quinone oxidoreductase subunit L [Desulfobacteraceae bacterium]|nr:MAG: NADH-quinone oxidoreductase subunit L [Desulfobacteraceae bacterium]
MSPSLYHHAVHWAALAALLLPLSAFGLIMLATRRYARLSAGIAIASSGGAMSGGLFLLIVLRDLKEPLQVTYTWMVSGDFHMTFGYLLDPLSLLMLIIVAAISFLVQVYSLGYMAGDPGFARYYAFLSLFAWAMLSLTLAPNLLQLYIFWELVGLSSYLLIGFWYEKFSASEAGKKAFVMTRLGDVLFFIGILLVLLNAGNLNILELTGQPTGARLSPFLQTAAALLIFGGIVGKSAQFPLLTWLPDAMEGPTPVSALLHSATMVAAGVFLLARLFPFFSASPTAMSVCLAVGAISMLLAATMAMVADDIKQVWAFSTISQLGLMLMALGAGGYAAGVFHLTTHAGFKALLFLSAGVFIHAFGTNDLFAIGQAGGRKRQRTATLCMIVAAAALAGLPPFSGFFSKELIMGRLADHPNPVWLAAGLLGVALTAYYTFRLIFIILFPRRGIVPKLHADAAVHAAHPAGEHIMSAVLLVLAAATLVLGWVEQPIGAFLARTQPADSGADHHTVWLPFVTLALALGGMALAFWEFGRRGAAQKGFIERFPALRRFFAERWYLDRLYRHILDHLVYRGLARSCAKNDQKVIDAGLDGLAQGTIGSGRLMHQLHAGMIQYKLLSICVAMLLLSVYFLF